MPEFGKVGSFFKADLEITFKNLQKKYDTNFIDLYAFFEAIEVLSQKLYKDQEDLSYGDKVGLFLEAGLNFFTDFV